MKHNLYQFFFNAEKWRSSPTCTQLSLAGRGAYIELLAASWLNDDCTLPADEKALRRIVRPDSDQEWAEVWPDVSKSFVKKGDRIHNKVLKAEFDRVHDLYKVRSAAGSKGGSKPQAKPQAKPKQKPSNKGVEHKNSEHKNSEPRPRDKSRGELTSTSAVIASAGIQGQTPLDEFRGYVNELQWQRYCGFYLWASENFPAFEELVSRVRGGNDPAICETKGWTQITNPGGFLRSEVEKWAEQYGIVIP